MPIPIFNYFLICIFYSSLGIILGIITKKISFEIKNYFNLSKILYIFINIFISIFIFYVIEMHISKKFGHEWQSDTAGLFFIATYFFSLVILGQKDFLQLHLKFNF